MTEDGLACELDGSGHFFTELTEWVALIHEKADIHTSKSTKVSLQTKPSELIPYFLFTRTDTEAEEKVLEREREAEKDRIRLEKEREERANELWHSIVVVGTDRSLFEYKEQYLALLNHRPYVFEPHDNRVLTEAPPHSRKNLLDPFVWDKPEIIPEDKVPFLTSFPFSSAHLKPLFLEVQTNSLYNLLKSVPQD